jgi:hypothetical protein
MNPRRIQNSPSGRLLKVGQSETTYRAFVPHPLPPAFTVFIWDTLLLAILALLPLLFFWPVVTPNREDRLAFPGGDLTGQYYPLRFLVAQELGGRRLPLWNPYAYAGQPALADIQSAVFYPVNLLTALLLGWPGLRFSFPVLELQIIFHFSLVSIFTYLFARRLTRKAGAGPGAGRFAGAVAALTFTYSGYLTSFPVQQVTILETATWLPLILLFLDMATDRLEPSGEETRFLRENGFLRPALLAGVALGLALLAGHPQTALYLFLGMIAYGVFKIWGAARAVDNRPVLPGMERTADRMIALRGVVVLGMTLLVGVALAAVELLPALEFIRLSPRTALSYEEVSFGLPLPEVVALIFPGYLGGSPQYVGIVPMVLIALAIFCARPRREVAFWAGLGGGAFLLALGGNTFLYPLFYVLVPGFGAVRDQERAFLLFAFSAAMLAAHGALLLVRPLAREVRPSFAALERWLWRLMVIGLALTALFFYGWIDSQARQVEVNVFTGVLRHHVFALAMSGGALLLLALRRGRYTRRAWGMGLALAFIALNLFTINWRYNLKEPGEKGYFPASTAVAFLKAQEARHGEPFRISSAGLLPAGAGAGALYGLQDTLGNSPLHLASYEAFTAHVSEWRRWQLLNVHYVLDRRDLDGQGLERVHEEGDVKVYRVTDPFPRAWVVGVAEAIPDDAGALARLDASDFNPRQAALLAEGPPLALPGPLSGTSAHVIDFAPNRIALDVVSPANGLLVLSEIYYPGWEARIDGEPVPVLRANYLLRAIPVPQGQHYVEVFYDPLSFKVGAVITAVTLVGLVAGLVVAFKPQKYTE